MRARIGEIANRLLHEIAQPSRFDVIEEYAKPLPTLVITEMLGVDGPDQKDFKRWSDAQTHMFNPSRTAEQLASLKWGREALSGYFAEVVRKRRKNRGHRSDQHPNSGRRRVEQLSESEIISTCHLLLFAGNVTTTDLIGNGVLALLRHPDELAKLNHTTQYDGTSAAADCHVPVAHIGDMTTAISQSDLAHFQDLTPQLTLAVTLGSRHFAPLIVPDQINAMLARFIALRPRRGFDGSRL